MKRTSEKYEDPIEALQLFPIPTSYLFPSPFCSHFFLNPNTKTELKNSLAKHRANGFNSSVFSFLLCFLNSFFITVPFAA